MKQVSRRYPEIRRILDASFPGYRGRKIRLAPMRTCTVGAGWEDGSRDQHVAVELSTSRPMPLGQARGQLHPSCVPVGVVVVERSFFCGRDAGVTILVHPTDIAPLLSPPTTLTEAERVVLGAHVRYNSRGRREAFATAGLSTAELESAYASLVRQKLLTRGRAINDAGRDAWAAAES